jgi:uncharacterized protein
MSSAAKPQGSLSAADARRIALAAQGFGRPRPRGTVTRRHIRDTLQRLQLVQLDSVNVAVRSHYMPFFSRLGAYDRSLVDSDLYTRRTAFEYWAHEASLVPIEQYPLFRHRMEDNRWMRWHVRIARDHPDYIKRVLEEVRARGPIGTAELEDGGKRTGPWWGYGKGKVALEYHFARGHITAHSRRNFARVYDVAERVIPVEVRELPAVSSADAHREMVRRSARAMGVATDADLADYYRLQIGDVRPRIVELVEAGELLPVEVEGWARPGYLHAEAKIQRSVEARAVLSPFDSLVWRRERTERIFNFHYRIEIYTPEPKRVFGYYVMPFLMGDQLVGRVDLKADRKASVLIAKAAHMEPAANPGAVAEAVAEALREMAAWVGLDSVRAEPRGELAPALIAAIGGQA